MKISIITDADPYFRTVGGIYNYVDHLTCFLIKNGVTVELIGRIRTKERGKRNILCDSFVGINSKSNFGFLRKLFFLKKADSDVFLAQRADFLVPFIKAKGRKVIIYHGNPSRELFDKKGFWTGMIFRMLERKAVDKADAIVVVNSDVKKYLEERYMVGRKVHVIPVGVDIKIFRPMDKQKMRKKHRLGKEKIVLFVGRFSIEKQVDYIIETLKDLPNTKLVLVGEGSLNNVPSNVIVKDPMKHEQLAELMNCADCLVLFSKYEGMPTVILEAMACGIPVVSSDVGDVKKVVIAGKTGYIATRSNFRQKVQAVLNNSKHMKSKCVEIAAKYSWDNIFQKSLRVMK